MSGGDVRDKNAVRIIPWKTVLGGAVGRGCTPSDVDGILECNGYWLVFEKKHPREREIDQAAARVLDTFLMTGTATVLVVTIDENLKASHMRGHTHWGKSIDRKIDNAGLRRWVESWFKYIDSLSHVQDVRLATNSGYFSDYYKRYFQK